MKLVVLGSTGYHPNDHRQTACFMLPQQGIVLDAGTGMFRVRDWLATDELDVFVTHAHLDHIIGLTYLFDVLEGRTMRRVTVHATPETHAAVDRHLFAEPLFPVKLPHEMRPLEQDTALAEGGRLTHFPVKHPGGATAFRLDWPERSLAYVTDTTAGPDVDYVDKIRGVDLLIHECYFRDEMSEWAKETGHSYVTPVVEVAKRANVGRLIMVHVNPLETGDEPIDLDKARSIFPATEIGYDGMEVEF